MRQRYRMTAALLALALVPFGGMAKRDTAKAAAETPDAEVLREYTEIIVNQVNNVDPAFRSRMNVPFFLKDTSLDQQFIAEAKENNLISLKGHRVLGGMRASIYNAMPLEGVKALVAFMEKFAAAHK